MTAPTRLLDGPGDAYTRGLLQSAVLDEPDDSALDRALLGLASVSAPVAALLATKDGASLGVSGSALSASHVAANGIPLGGKASSIAIIVKWLGIGAVGGIVTAGGLVYVAEKIERPSAVSATLPRPEESRVQRSALEPAHAATETRASEDLAQAQATEPSIPKSVPFKRRSGPVDDATPIASIAGFAPSSTGAAATSRGASPLGAEVEQLDRARQALARGDTAGALRALDAYAASPRTGVLDREAMIVRIDALVSSGQKPRAVELARRYLAEFPGDPHARQLTDLAGTR